MNGDDTARFVYALLCIMLVAASLFSRRLPFGQTVKMIVAWLGIFAGMFVFFLFLPELKVIGKRAQAELVGGGIEQDDGSLLVRKSEDGHFYLDTTVNGSSVRFMVDSGATTTSLSMSDARAAGVDIDLTGFPVTVSTANGTAEMRRARLGELKVGSIARQDFPVLVSDTLGDTNLIGMNFLSTLQGWRIEGETLILNPK